MVMVVMMGGSNSGSISVFTNDVPLGALIMTSFHCGYFGCFYSKDMVGGSLDMKRYLWEGVSSRSRCTHDILLGALFMTFQFSFFSWNDMVGGSLDGRRGLWEGVNSRSRFISSYDVSLCALLMTSFHFGYFF